MTIGIQGDPRVTRAIAAASNQRVHLFGLGDSNFVRGGHGWHDAFEKALAATYDMYTTAFLSPNNADKSNYSVGHKYRETAGDAGVTTGAPSELAIYAESTTDGLGGLFDYVYVADGSIVGSGSPVGIDVDADCPIDVNANLRFDAWYGTFDTGSGSFRPRFRRNENPWWGIAYATAATSTNTGTLGNIEKVSLSISAATRNYPIAGGYVAPQGSDMIGPIFSPFCRLLNTDRPAGFGYTAICYLGGQSAQDFAEQLQAQTTEFLTLLFGAARDDATELGQSPRIVITINGGLNDRNETETSAGTAAITDGDSSEAFADNLEAIIDKIEGVWTTNGWPLDELHFLVMPSHPVSDPDDVELVGYFAAAVRVANRKQRVAVADITALHPSGDFSSNGWYESGGADTSHLTQAGYEAVSAAVVSAVAEHAATASGAALSVTLDAIATQVRAELATELGYLDVAVSSRNATAPLSAEGIRDAVGIDAANLEAQLDAIKAVADSLSVPAGLTDVVSWITEMSEDDGGVRRWTANALELAPVGSVDLSGVEADLDTILQRTAGGVTVTVSSPTLPDGSIEPLTQGDAYLDTDGRGLTFTLTDHGLDLTGATATLAIKSRASGVSINATASPAESGDDATVTFDLTAAQTGQLSLGAFVWDLQLTIGSPGRPVTLARGESQVVEQVAA